MYANSAAEAAPALQVALSKMQLLLENPGPAPGHFESSLKSCKDQLQNTVTKIENDFVMPVVGVTCSQTAINSARKHVDKVVSMLPGLLELLCRSITDQLTITQSSYSHLVSIVSNVSWLLHYRSTMVKTQHSNLAQMQATEDILVHTHLVGRLPQFIAVMTDIAEGDAAEGESTPLRSELSKLCSMFVNHVLSPLVSNPEQHLSSIGRGAFFHQLKLESTWSIMTSHLRKYLLPVVSMLHEFQVRQHD